MRILSFLFIILLLAACNRDPQAESLQVPQEAYDLTFQLPEGWHFDRAGELRVDGGYGFASPDYEGLTYLRLHQGASFVVIGEWESPQNAVDLLSTAFARDISESKPITVLGVEGTYATGKIDQGQSIGGVFVEIDQKRYGFLSTVAGEWATFESTFLAIIQSIARES